MTAKMDAKRTHVIQGSVSHSGRLPAGPGSSLKTCKKVWPLAIVWRANSVCTTTLTKHESKTNHSRVKPATAPSLVVTISSPDPTIEPARIIPGPR